MSTSIRQIVYCDANFFRHSGHLISYFLDEIEWETFEAKNRQLQCIFILSGVMILTVIEQLST